jgi:tRNA(His) 5'-end guanylyltransferase
MDLPTLKEDIFPPLNNKGQMQNNQQENTNLISEEISEKTSVSLTPSTILEIIKNARMNEEIVPNHTAYLGMSKTRWDQFGDVITEHEKILTNIGKSSVWTIRLDGKNFSPLVRSLRSAGVLQPGYSSEFGEMMVKTANVVMDEIHACCAFIQSDEMTLIVPACKEEQTPHYGGRLQKLVSTSASLATFTFYNLILELARKNNVDLPMRPITFDARIGQWNSIAEAFTLILWRSYDCSVNGVSDAVLHMKAGKEIREKNTTEKLKFLSENKMLPLHPHQAFGTLLWTTREPKECINQKTGEKTMKDRLVTKQNNLYLPGAFHDNKIVICDYSITIWE